MPYDPRSPNIAIVILAAGQATRFGGGKLTATVAGKPLIHNALKAAIEAEPVSIQLVVGHNPDAIVKAVSYMDLAAEKITLVENPNYAAGVGTSIAAGVTACRQSVDAILVQLADAPLLNAQHLQTLVASWSGSDHEIVASRFGESSGPPILFPHSCFDDLVQLEGDIGARYLLNDSRFQVRFVECEAAAIDIDSRDDLRRLEES